MHSPLTSALIHAEALPQPLEHLRQELFSIWLITCKKEKGKKKGGSNHRRHQLCQQVAAAAAAAGENSTQAETRKEHQVRIKCALHAA